MGEGEEGGREGGDREREREEEGGQASMEVWGLEARRKQGREAG